MEENAVAKVRPLSKEDAATLYFLPLLYVLERKGQAPVLIEARGYVREKELFMLQMINNETGNAYMGNIYQYNKTWRLWNKWPTLTERSEAKWEKIN